jgi:hypothetical protein
MRWEKGLAIEAKLLSRHRTNGHLLTYLYGINHAGTCDWDH